MLPDASEVKQRRRKLGLTQSELAKKAGVSQSLVAKIESRKADATYSHLKSIFDFLEEAENQTVLTAKAVMNSRIFFVHKSDSVGKAIELMRKHDFSQFPVFEHNHAVGSVSEKSVIEKISAGLDAKSLSRMRCGEIMDEAFPLVSLSTPLPAVSELLKHHFAVLVRKGEKTVGIITKSDLLKTVS